MQESVSYLKLTVEFTQCARTNPTSSNLQYIVFNVAFIRTRKINMKFFLKFGLSFRASIMHTLLARTLVASDCGRVGWWTAVAARSRLVLFIILTTSCIQSKLETQELFKNGFISCQEQGIGRSGELGTKWRDDGGSG